MISPQLDNLIASLGTSPARTELDVREGPRFVVNRLTSSVGSFYERLRYAVDYQEEHLLRRVAVERILRRLVRFAPHSDIGVLLLEELVRARYVKNDTVPESIAGDLQALFERYCALQKHIAGDSEMVWSYAAIEIEELLFPSELDERVFTAVFQTVVGYFRPKEEGVLDEARFNLRVYIGCRRAFLRESHAALSFALFKMMVSEWHHGNSLTETELKKVGDCFPSVQQEISHLLQDTVSWKVASRLKNESIYYSIVRAIVSRYGVEARQVLENDDRLNDFVSKLLEHTYESHREKTMRSGTRAIIYVLITKIIIGLAVELPYEVFILQEVNYVALGINIIFFPILLMFMTKTIAYPSTKNTEEILKGLRAFVVGERPETRYITLKQKSVLQRMGQGLFLLTFFGLSFGGIIYGLEFIHFNPASIALFLLFLCIVAYMGLRIRHKSREWTLETEDESLGGLVWFLLVMPITRTGRWLSEQLSSMNIFVFFLDFILETPFKLILGSFDSFVSFVKESKRDGL